MPHVVNSLRSQLLGAKIDVMLAAVPNGVADKCLSTFNIIGPLSVRTFRDMAPEYAPVILPEKVAWFSEWKDGMQRRYSGSVLKHSGKEHGIVRTLTPGHDLKEVMYKSGKEHGFGRIVKANGEYRHSFWDNGKP